jgi:hypothetical protein
MEEQITNQPEDQQADQPAQPTQQVIEITEISTPSGSIYIEHKMTLGDLTVSILLLVLIITTLLKWFISKVWD